MSGEPKWTAQDDASLVWSERPEDAWVPADFTNCLWPGYGHDAGRALAADVAAARRLDQIRDDAVWMAKLARGSSWPGEMAEYVEQAANRVIAALTEDPQ